MFFGHKYEKKNFEKKKFFLDPKFFLRPHVGLKGFQLAIKDFLVKKLHLGVSPLVALNFKASLTTINSPVFRVSALKNEWFS